MKQSKHKFLLSILIILLLSFFCCKQQDKVDVDADKAAIKEIWNQWMVACKTGDVELLMSLMDDNMVQMPPSAPTNIGKEAILPGEEALLGTFDIEGPPMLVEEVEIVGDWGFSRLTFTYSITPKEGGETSTFTGKDLAILKKQSDGSWKVYIDCWNFDGPPKVEESTEPTEID